MDFCLQLSADYPDTAYGSKRVYDDMLEQATLADQLGFESVSLTEHHLINMLMMPAPLQFAVKIAGMTKNVKIITAVVVLPLHDMRVYAGEVIVADIFTDGRLLLGVGRGAFPYETERLGVPMDETLPRFNESLDVLQALLSKEEVSWHGKYYNFDALTVMPRPERPGGPPLMMAVLNPEGIYHCTKRGFHIQTTPLSGNHQLLVDQVSAFNRAKQELADSDPGVTLTLSRVGHIARSDAERDRKVEAAHRYYGRFYNIREPGLVDNGKIRELPCPVPIDELGESLLVCTEQEMVDKLGVYADLGIDRLIINMNFGLEQQDTMDSIARFAENVMPHFADRPASIAAQ